MSYQTDKLLRIPCDTNLKEALLRLNDNDFGISHNCPPLASRISLYYRRENSQRGYLPFPLGHLRKLADFFSRPVFVGRFRNTAHGLELEGQLKLNPISQWILLLMGFVGAFSMTQVSLELAILGSVTYLGLVGFILYAYMEHFESDKYAIRMCLMSALNTREDVESPL